MSFFQCLHSFFDQAKAVHSSSHATVYKVIVSNIFKDVKHMNKFHFNKKNKKTVNYEFVYETKYACQNPPKSYLPHPKSAKTINEIEALT